MSQQDTRTVIMDAAQALIQRRGVNAISYQHIADAVGIRKASIHYHFPTKEDLIEALLERFSAGFEHQLLLLDASRGTAAERLHAYVALFEETFRQGDAVCLYGMLGAELASLGGRSATRVGSFYRRNVEWLEQLLHQGAEDGTLAIEGPPATLALMIFSLLEGGMLVARADAGPDQYQALTRELTSLLSLTTDTSPSAQSATGDAARR